ncbi:putative disease resistance protein RGA3 [Chenopodium quinoa]|uniref:putative disease resistance protein RGA3 n=1 Tax=Chenopodium quinoa TaxID=63459 RepID=UPI000B77F32E|nr:putative disease resistance protein RGA3 [Chenopodium quinoa]
MEIGFGTAVSAVDSLNETLRTLESKELISKYGFKSQIGELLVTVPKLRDLFLLADELDYLSAYERLRIQGLKYAVFEANQVLEEIVVQLLKDRGGLVKKVRLYWVAYCVSQKLRKIRNKLDIRDLFNSIDDNIVFLSRRKENSQETSRRKETCSYLRENSIIGRDDEVENIIGMLLDSSNVQCNPSFLSIVGFGGLGKTALAQLVFNHPRVHAAFPLRLWTCISNDQNQLDICGTLKKILESANGQNHEGSTMDQVQSQLREQLASQRYLLVLDDVWTENHIKWDELVKNLVGPQKGSWILVTTRSKTTATMVGGAMYELQALSKDNSWHLFAKIAFRPDQSNPPDELVTIGRNIVDECAGHPLAIRVAGSLFCGQAMVRWQTFQKIGLAYCQESQRGIAPILKLSFQNLESPLKSCFSYCALFPKGFEIEKEKLKSLWMAQGYISFHEGQSIEEACEEYFSILLNRCFFQVVKKDHYGQIVSCKIHDLMHDVSQHISGQEMYVMKASCSELDKNVRHLSVSGTSDEYNLGRTNILSYLHFCEEGFQLGKVNMSYLESLVANCLNLKALDLSGFILERLPDSVSKLVQLRYLNISGNTEMKFLPKSITELDNLQTLMLRWCCTLKELPSDLGRLDKLRLLDIRGCISLTCMPSSMGKLTCLHSLSDYIVGDEQSYSSQSQWFGGLDDLKHLNNLRGCLNIQIRWPRHVKYVVKEDDEQDELCLGNKEHLIVILFDFIHEEADGRAGNEEAERLMEKLHPHHNLKFLEVKKYHGLKMPNWVAFLPNLVEICLTDCRELEYLPCLENLLCLKVLRLVNLAKLEWVGEDNSLADSSSTPTPHQLSSTEGLSYLLSLETIEMSNLPKLKGWRRGAGDDHQFLSGGSNNSSSNKAKLQSLPSFTALKSLFIWNCPELTYFPPCPNMEDLSLLKFNSRLQMILNCERGENLGVVVIPFASSSSWSPHPKNSTKLT